MPRPAQEREAGSDLCDAPDFPPLDPASIHEIIQARALNQHPLQSNLFTYVRHCRIYHPPSRPGKTGARPIQNDRCPNPPGPDAHGAYSDPAVRLGHRRLSILDLSGGAQPMSSADGRWHLVFNGEIYNYLELRRDLEARGATFRTQSDTEVLLQAWAEDGASCLSRLNGMFAFAIWDSAEKRLTLVRDP